MEPINWLAQDTFEDYGVILHNIISAAETADVGERSELIQILKRFVEETPPEATQLDDIASDLSDSLLLQNIDAHIAAIATYNERLIVLIPDIEAIANGAPIDD